MVNLSDQVGDLEGQIDGLYNRLDSLKSEVQKVSGIEKNMAMMMDQFALLMAHWDEQERGRKGKREGTELPQGSSSFMDGMPEVRMGRGDGDEGVGGAGRSDFKGRRLEMLVFEGEDPDGWIFRAERYFTINQLTKLEKLVVMHRIRVWDYGLAPLFYQRCTHIPRPGKEAVKIEK